MTMMTRFHGITLAVAGSLLASTCAHADVIVHGTRQVFPGDQREITVRTENVGKRPALVQAWIDDGDKLAGPEEVSTPFVLRPPVYRLEAGKTQVMRILFTGADLPQDRESIYWLNVLDIPPAPSADATATGNYMQFSLRTRTKLLYRPKGLAGVASNAPTRLQWSMVADGSGWALQAHNPTPYHVHLSTVSLGTQGKEYTSAEPAMIAPLSSQTYPLPQLAQRATQGNVRFQYINDQGGLVAQSVPLSGN